MLQSTGGAGLPLPLGDEDDYFDDEEEDVYPQDFAFESIDVGMAWYRRCHIVLTRAKNTKTCLVIYVGLAIVCGLLFGAAAFGAHKLRNHMMFTIVEALINLMLVLEVFIDIMGMGMVYFTKLYNLLDFTVTISCVAFFFAFLEEERNVRVRVAQA